MKVNINILINFIKIYLFYMTFLETHLIKLICFESNVKKGKVKIEKKVKEKTL